MTANDFVGGKSKPGREEPSKAKIQERLSTILREEVKTVRAKH